MKELPKNALELAEYLSGSGVVEIEIRETATSVPGVMAFDVFVEAEGATGEKVRGEVQARLTEFARLSGANLVGTVLMIARWRKHDVGKLAAEAAEWKRRAGKHGCDVEKGDPDCG